MSPAWWIFDRPVLLYWVWQCCVAEYATPRVFELAATLVDQVAAVGLPARENLQCLGGAAFLLASKYEDGDDAVCTWTVVRLGAGSFDWRQLVAEEWHVAAICGYRLTRRLLVDAVIELLCVGGQPCPSSLQLACHLADHVTLVHSTCCDAASRGAHVIAAATALVLRQDHPALDEADWIVTALRSVRGPFREFSNHRRVAIYPALCRVHRSPPAMEEWREIDRGFRR